MNFISVIVIDMIDFYIYKRDKFEWQEENEASLSSTSFLWQVRRIQIRRGKCSQKTEHVSSYTGIS